MKRRPFIALALAAGVAALPTITVASDFPTRPVRLVVPFPPGGITDAMARLYATHLQAAWGQAVVVENKPGAGTIIGTDFVAKSAPDGHTLGLVVPQHVVNPSLQKKMPFDTLRDLSGVTLLATFPIALFASPKLPVNSVPELIAYAKKNPGKLSYGSPGNGSMAHLAGAEMNLLSGTDLLHLPYKGSAPAQADLMAGNISVLFDALSGSLGSVKAGRIKLLAVATEKRSSVVSDVPAVAETLPGFHVEGYFGLVVPSATPRWIVERLSADISAMMAKVEVKNWLDQQGMTRVVSRPADFDAFIEREMKRWAAVVERVGIKID